jgi:O-antigen biosynthesis protein
MFKPVKIIDIELSEPLASFDNLHGYEFVGALIRLHGTPVGKIKIRVTNGCCSKAEIANVILKEHSKAIIFHLLSEGLTRNMFSGSFRITDPLRRSRQVSPAADLPVVTIAVCTRNNTALLRRCLESLVGIRYSNLEIIIVDNAPDNDSTERLVSTTYMNMRYVRESRPGLNWARNRAIAEAKGDIIAYTDDDVEVDPLWIEALASIFSDSPEVMAVTGLVVPCELETEAQELFEDYGGFGRGFERKWIRADASMAGRLAKFHGGTGKFGTGANMAFRRSLFDEIGTFDPALDVGTVTNGGGDLDIFFRVLKGGHTLVYEPKAIVRHIHRRETAQLKTQLTNWGVGFFSYLTRNAMVFPDERKAFIRLGLGWFWTKFRHVLISLSRPARLRDFYRAELQGSWMGLFRYKAARSEAEKIRNSKPETSASDETGPAIPANPVIRFDKRTAVRIVDLNKPLAALSDLHGYRWVQVIANMNGRPLTTFRLETLGQAVNTARLAEALAQNPGLRLLDPDHTRSREALFAESYSALRQCLLHEQGGPETTRGSSDGLPEKFAVSIIVATYDRPGDLYTCLSHLSEQKSSRRIEIIVVDNNPESGLTPPVAAAFPDVILVQEPRKGLSYARNAGVIACTGDIVVMVDDDVATPLEWLEELLKPFVRTDVMIVTGNVLPMELDTPAQELFEATTRRAVPTWKIGATANAAFRAAIFSHPQIGLLDEALGAGTPTGCSEDTYLFYKVLKAGYSIVYHPSAYVLHRHRSTISGLRRQIFNYSKGHVAYHLTTLFRERDSRALIRLLLELPRVHLLRMKQQILRRSAYPFSLTALEIAGNLAGPFALWRSRRRVRRLGRSSTKSAAAFQKTSEAQQIKAEL